jgi:hypothetical protein
VLSNVGVESEVTDVGQMFAGEHVMKCANPDAYRRAGQVGESAGSPRLDVAQLWSSGSYRQIGMPVLSATTNLSLSSTPCSLIRKWIGRIFGHLTILYDPFAERLAYSQAEDSSVWVMTVVIVIAVVIVKAMAKKIFFIIVTSWSAAFQNRNAMTTRSSRQW